MKDQHTFDATRLLTTKMMVGTVWRILGFISHVIRIGVLRILLPHNKQICCLPTSKFYFLKYTNHRWYKRPNVADVVL